MVSTRRRATHGCWAKKMTRRAAALMDLAHYLFFETRSGLPLRLVEANSSNCFSLIDSYILLDAPLSLLTGVSPRLAARAAPAAFCCALDFAGIWDLRLNTSVGGNACPPRAFRFRGYFPLRRQPGVSGSRHLLLLL